MSLDAACELSLARLALLARAAAQREARRALLDLNCLSTAIGAAMSKEGGRNLKKLHAQLLKEANG